MTSTAFLQNGGEVGALIQAHDWSGTPVGPIEGWPQSLKTAVGILLRSPVPIVLLWGEEGVMLYNDAYSLFAGKRHPQLLGSKVREGWPEVAEFNDHVMKVGLAGGTLAYKDQELTLYRDGSPEQVWMNLDYSPVPDESGAPAGVIAIVVENTARVLAERSSIAERERLRRMFDQAPGFMLMLRGPTHVVELANAAYTQLIGHRDAIGKTIREALPEVEGQGFFELLDQVYASGQPFVGTGVAVELQRAPDGPVEQRFLDFVYQPILDEQGAVNGIFVEGYDVTEARLAAEALRESEERSRRIVEGVKDYAVFVTDADGIILDWTPGAEAVFGWPAEQILGHNSDLLFIPEDRAAGVPVRELQTARDTGCANDERWHIRRDGTRFFADGSVRPLHAADGGVAGFIKIARDETERRSTEARLRASEEFNRRVLASSADCIKVLDLGARMEFMSEGGMCVMEVDDFGAIEGKCWPDFWEGEEHVRALAAVEEAMSGGTGRFQGFAPTAKGSPRWWDVIVTPINGPDGEPEKLLSISRDITATKEAEVRLAQSEVRYRTLFEAIDVGFCIIEMKFDEDGQAIDYRFAETNPAFERQTGLKGAAGKWASEAVPGLERHWFEVYGQVARTGEAVRFENRAAPFARWYDVHAFRTGAPEEQRVAILFNDITSRKNADDRLRELNATLEERVAERTAERNMLARIIENTDVMVMASDLEYNILATNKANADEFERIYGVRPRPGDNMLDLLKDQPEHQAQVRTGWARALAGEETTFVEAFGDPSRDRPFFEISFRPLLDGAGKRIGAYQFVADVTERLAREHQLAETQEALRQSQKVEALGQLTGGIAHDFNNLLTVIRGSADLLRRGDLPEDKRRRYIEAISNTADRAAKLTSQLLAFARRQSLRPEIFDTVERLRGIKEMLATLLGSRVIFSIEAADGEDCFVEADAAQFETALVNMAVNARDAMGGEGELTIAIRRVPQIPRIRGHEGAEAPFVAISVTDTGSGIPPEHLDRIFEPFFTTKEVGKGTGLGLSQLFGFAKQSGGEVDVRSRVGEGTTFTLYLPRAHQELPAPVANADDAGTDAFRGRILVVEDNEEVGAFATELIADLGYETTLAGNAQQALEELERDSHVFSIVFSDVVMPGMSGVELGKRIRERWPTLPVVLTSGYSHVLVQDTQHGFPLLRKPYSVEDLSLALREAASA